jgi:hypothetical protein
LRASGAAREALLFARRHVRHVPLLLALPFAGTAVHEAAHAVAAAAQGARITRIELGPWASDGRHWGSVGWDPPPGGLACEACVSLAPYVLWAVVGAATAAWILLRPPRDRERSPAFVAGYALVPLDLLQHVVAWLAGSRTNDLAHGLGDPAWWSV